jgi:hypothetical protein
MAVATPTMIPPKPAWAGYPTAMVIPPEPDEAIRYLSRACEDAVCARLKARQ